MEEARVVYGVVVGLSRDVWVLVCFVHVEEHIVLGQEGEDFVLVEVVLVVGLYNPCKVII